MSLRIGQWGAEAVFGSGGILATSTPVNVYQTGTTTPVSLFTDATGGTSASNPVNTNSLGDLTFFTAGGPVDLNFTVGGIPTTITVIVYPNPSDSGWVTPTLGNGFTAGSTAPADRLAGNTMRLRGVLVAGASSANLAAWTLATGSRPSTPFEQIVAVSGGFTTPVYCTISTAGVVSLTQNSVTCFLDGLTFTTD